MTRERLSDTIILHFDAHQKGYIPGGGHQKKNRLVIDNVCSRAELLQQHLSTVDGRATDAIESTVLCCVKTSLAASSASESDDEAVERILDLAAVYSFKFSRSCYAGLWNLAIQVLQSAIVSFRCKGCYLIERCLQILSESEENDVIIEYCKLAEKTLTPRLSDKNHLVRSAAIHSCQFVFIQECQREQLYYYWPSKIEEGLIVAMAHDSSFANRALAVQCIPISEDTLPFIVERISDVKPKVRECALSTLQTKVKFDQLQEQQRIDIVSSGLTERCRSTYEATVKLLCCNWLKRFDFNPLDLVRNLLPVENERVCEKCIKAIILAADDDSDKFLIALSVPEREALRQQVQAASLGIKAGLLDPAKSLFIRVQFSLIVDSNSVAPMLKSEKIAKILPDLATLCDVFQTQLEQHVHDRRNIDDVEQDDGVDSLGTTSSFICSQILSLAKKTDVQEEAGLRRLSSLIHTMLCSSETPEELIEPSVQTLVCMQSSEKDFIRCISEALLEVGCTNESAQKEEIMSRQLRVLSIMSIAMENIALTNVQKSLLQGFPDRILPLMTSEDNTVRQAAVSCLGKYALFADKDSFSTIFIDLTKNPQEKLEIKAQALLALCDLALLENIVLDEKTGLGRTLCDFLKHEEAALVIVAAEACVKLFLCGKILSHVILAQIIIIFFTISDVMGDRHPEHSSDVGSPRRLQQILSIFFPAFCLSHETNRVAMLQAIKPLINQLINLPETSGKKKKKSLTLVTTSIPKMIDFICSTVTLAYPDEDEHPEEEVKTRPTKGGKDASVNLSPELSAALAVSEALVENEGMSISNLRMVCKVLASVALTIDFDAANASSALKRQTWALKQNWEKLEVLVSDHYASASLEKLRHIIEQFDVFEDNDDVSSNIMNTVSSDTLEHDLSCS